jgi:hypothetical protein
MSELFLILGVAAVGMYWLASMRCKEIAIASARRECKLADVQLLDQTVNQNHISMSRDHTGSWRVWRRYRFEYSEDGVTRETGALVMLGQKVIRVALDTFDPIIH